MQLSFDVLIDRESFKTPEASLSTQDPGRRHTRNPSDTFLESLTGLIQKQFTKRTDSG